MSERQKQTEFLKALIRWGDTEPCRKLQERLQKAQRDENSIRRKICGLLLLALISLTGFGYTAVFLPDAFRYSLPLLVQLFCVLGLGALICLTIFLVWWLWYRAVVNCLLEEGRALVRMIFQTRLEIGDANPPRQSDSEPSLRSQPDPASLDRELQYNLPTT